MLQELVFFICFFFYSIYAEEKFTEASVRNEIENFPYLDELGEKLGIPPGKRAEITNLSPEKKKLKFVEILFRVDADCNWTRLKMAIKEVDTMMWTKKHSWQKTGSGSLGSYSEEMFSPTHSSSISSVSGIYQYSYTSMQ